MFNIVYEDDKGEKQRVWQNSWGLTTRTIGVMVMVHGDNKGLVLPPRIAPKQVVIVPIYFGKDTAPLNAQAAELEKQLKSLGLRVTLDDRANHNPGWKFNDWEMRGVPLRMELGPRDMESRQVVIVRRDNGEKTTVSWDDLNTVIPATLAQMQRDMLARAKQEVADNIVRSLDWKTFMSALDKRSMALAPWCGVMECEENIKERSGQESTADESEQSTEDSKFQKLTGAAKSLCIPFDQPELGADAKCVGCGKNAINWTLFGRSY